MFNLTNISTFLIGTSYSFLIINKIYFGIVLSLGILIFLSQNFRKLKELSKISLKKIMFITTPCFFILVLFTFNSIIPWRSFEVLTYLILIFIFSFLFYRSLNNKKLDKISYFLSLSIFINSVVIFGYNLLQFDFEMLTEVRRFKGFLNIHTLLVLIIPFFYKSKINYFSLITLIPNIYMSNSNSSFMGLILVSIAVLYLKLLHTQPKFKNFNYVILFLIPLLSGILYNNLPKNTDLKYVSSFNFVIPLNLIDAHRQFIWGFSIEKFKEKPLLGFGPDTSNFIDGSQEMVGSIYTGTMNYIPSHPHNFLIELLLETGLIGTSIFLLFLLFINYNIFKNINHKYQYALILLNVYFWGTSLVNFSFWLGWWQASYYLLLSIISIKIIQKTT